LNVDAARAMFSHATYREPVMLDLIYLCLGIFLFALAAVYARACARL